MATQAQPDPDIAGFFEDNGYYLAPGVYSEDTLGPLEEDFDRMVGQLEHSGENINARWEGAYTDGIDGGESRILHTHNVQRYSSRWLDALRQTSFLDVAETILGPDIVLHHTKLFQKPPREGAPFPMHQDWTYFPSHRDSMVAGIIFLTDADAESGGLCVYPGSHKLGRIDDSSGRTASKVLDEYPLERATPVEARRGDVFFFSYLTLHGSTPNRSDRHRKTVLAQLISGRDYIVRREGQNHVNEQLVLRGWNYHMSRNQADR